MKFKNVKAKKIVITLLGLCFLLTAVLLVAKTLIKEENPESINPNPVEEEGINDNVALGIIREEGEKDGILEMKLIIVDERKIGGKKTLVLMYDSQAEDVGGIGQEIASFSGTFIGLKKQEWDIDGLSATVVDDGGTAIAQWKCSKEQAESYLSEQISDKEFIASIFSTYITLEENHG